MLPRPSLQRKDVIHHNVLHSHETESSISVCSFNKLSKTDCKVMKKAKILIAFSLFTMDHKCNRSRNYIRQERDFMYLVVYPQWQIAELKCAGIM